MSFWILLLLWSALGYFDRVLVTPQGGVPWWGALGAALGVVTWKQAWQRKLKLPVALGLLFTLFLATQGLLALGDSLPSLSAGLGSDTWVLTRQRLSAAATLLLWVGSLRQLSHHYPSAAALEVTASALPQWHGLARCPPRRFVQRPAMRGAVIKQPNPSLKRTSTGMAPRCALVYPAPRGAMPVAAA